MKSWFAIMIKEATRIAEILTPADFIGHHGKPPYINPGSRSILKSQMGCGDRAPEDTDWRGSWAPAVGLQGFDGRSEPTIIGVLPMGGR